MRCFTERRPNDNQAQNKRSLLSAPANFHHLDLHLGVIQAHGFGQHIIFDPEQITALLGFFDSYTCAQIHRAPGG